MLVDVYKGSAKILQDAKWCEGFLDSVRGYMFRRRGDFNGMVLTSPSEEYMPIHMFFVFFPISAYWLNSRFEVVDAREDIKPFNPGIAPNKNSQYVLESIKPLPLKIGDKITFRFVK